MYEGVPTYPTNMRMWDICDKHKVKQFYTAPTAIRALMACGEDEELTKPERLKVSERERERESVWGGGRRKEGRGMGGREGRGREATIPSMQVFNVQCS
jgi:hypothetical protein